jgi:hypothetical protein
MVSGEERQRDRRRRCTKVGAEKERAMSNDRAEIALKYLDLAREEIQEKGRFINQTLGAYVLGSSALASWFYQSAYRPAGPTPVTLTEPEKAAAAIGLAFMLSYLALGVNWIIHHNERIVAALALYQRNDLYPALGSDPPMWEMSRSLREEDSLLHAFFTVAIEELIVLAPPIAAFVFAIRLVGAAAWWPTHLWLPGAIAANALSVVIGVLMFRTKRKLRQ